MSRIKDASVDEVKAAADMVSVVSARSPLRKAGARYVGRCPFHEERTPSFSVNAVDKLYYCFGCGAKGDAITFVRETENLDFAGAIEWLGERFRVELEYDDESPRQDAERKRRERLLALLEQATGFYERYLWETPAGEPVRSYLAGRGLGEDVCKEFRLGLAPRGSMLVPKARAQGFSADELRAAGLAGRAAATTSPHGSCSRSPTRAAGSSASRRGGCATTTRSRPSTSTRRKASCSGRAISSTG